MMGAVNKLFSISTNGKILNSIVGVIDRVLSWQSKGLPNESIKPPTTPNNSLNPRLSYNDTKIKLQFTGSCLKQPRFTFTHKK